MNVPMLLHKSLADKAAAERIMARVGPKILRMTDKDREGLLSDIASIDPDISDSLRQLIAERLKK